MAADNPPTCRIQWVSPITGRPTPDEHPAVGTVYVQAHRDTSPLYPKGYHDVAESTHFPICADHLADLHREQAEHAADPTRHRGIEYWVFLAHP